MKYQGQTDYDHKGASPRRGVLLCNLGTPDAPRTSELRRYLKQFLSDPRVVEVPHQCSQFRTFLHEAEGYPSPYDWRDCTIHGFPRCIERDQTGLLDSASTLQRWALLSEHRRFWLHSCKWKRCRGRGLVEGPNQSRAVHPDPDRDAMFLPQRKRHPNRSASTHALRPYPTKTLHQP